VGRPKRWFEGPDAPLYVRRLTDLVLAGKFSSITVDLTDAALVDAIARRSGPSRAIGYLALANTPDYLSRESFQGLIETIGALPLLPEARIYTSSDGTVRGGEQVFGSFGHPALHRVAEWPERARNFAQILADREARPPDTFSLERRPPGPSEDPFATPERARQTLKRHLEEWGGGRAYQRVLGPGASIDAESLPEPHSFSDVLKMSEDFDRRFWTAPRKRAYLEDVLAHRAIALSTFPRVDRELRHARSTSELCSLALVLEEELPFSSLGLEQKVRGVMAYVERQLLRAEDYPVLDRRTFDALTDVPARARTVARQARTQKELWDGAYLLRMALYKESLEIAQDARLDHGTGS
jgi:hypothetical protein